MLPAESSGMAPTTSDAAPPSAAGPIERALAVRDRRGVVALLVAGAVGFLAYNFVFVPRLTNYHFGDIEFSGWSGPMGSRVLRGERPYVDFVLPIPPGSFVLLALIEKIAGRALLIQELWLNAIIHLALGGVAYAMCVPFTSRRNAALVAASTWVAVALLWKECAYDHTAQLMSWASAAAGIHALFADPERRRARLWLATGVLSGLTLAFKQSTALGSVAGWTTALTYLAAVETLSRQKGEARRRVTDLVGFAKGLLFGLAGVWLLLIALGSTLKAFLHAVFIDASVLKGGLGLLLRHLTNYLLLFPSYPSSLGVILALVFIAFRVVRRHGNFHVGDEPRRAPDAATWEAWAAAALVFCGFAIAIALLVKGPIEGFGDWVLQLDRLKNIPHVGLLFLIGFIASSFLRVSARDSSVPIVSDALRVGHLFNASCIAVALATLLHNTSAPEFRPFYDNNPIIVLSFLSIFIALDRAGLKWMKLVTLALVIASLFTHRYYRAMLATVPADESLHWAHLEINERGSVVETVARRARALTTPEDTVLVLPEDVQVTALIGRPRPPILGAIVFVDQYAPRLAEDDIARLAENPPKVIVVHPRKVYSWQRFFRIWSGDSGAERFIQYALTELIPQRYRLDSSYGTSFILEGAMLDVYVREDPAAPRRPDAPGPPPNAEKDAAGRERP